MEREGGTVGMLLICWPLALKWSHLVTMFRKNEPLLMSYALPFLGE